MGWNTGDFYDDRSETVQRQAVQLWDFDQDFDKIKKSCKMLNQVVFSEKSKIIKAKYCDGVVLVQHEDKTLFSAITLV